MSLQFCLISGMDTKKCLHSLCRFFFMANTVYYSLTRFANLLAKLLNDAIFKENLLLYLEYVEYNIILSGGIDEE